MSTSTILLIAIGLSLDAFTISFIKGITFKNFSFSNVIKIPVLLSFFQVLMFLIGLNAGSRLHPSVSNYSHWLVFFTFIFIGIKMICEGSQPSKPHSSNILLLGFIASIDAVIAGFSFALIPITNTLYSIKILTFITFFMSYIGLYLGYRLGTSFKYNFEYFGGIVLILIGIKSVF